MNTAGRCVCVRVRVCARVCTVCVGVREREREGKEGMCSLLKPLRFS